MNVVLEIRNSIQYDRWTTTELSFHPLKVTGIASTEMNNLGSTNRPLVKYPPNRALQYWNAQDVIIIL